VLANGDRSLSVGAWAWRQGGFQPRGIELVVEWPEWWEWELELSPHLLKRMVDRGFSETDLRSMMHAAAGCQEADQPGRWVVATTHGGRSWEVIVEPDSEDRLLVVITAYPVDVK